MNTQKAYQIKNGVVELRGIFLEVSGIRMISKPTPALAAGGTGLRCWVFYITLLTGQVVEILTYDPLDTINLYEKVTEVWLGVKPSDLNNLNEILGDGYFRDTEYQEE